MKILVLSHKFYPDIGGIEISSEILATAFNDAGHDVHLVTWSLDNTCKLFPFSVIRNPNLLRLFKEHTWADLVFENNLCLRLSWPGLFLKKVSVVTLQTWITDVNGKIRWIDHVKQKCL